MRPQLELFENTGPICIGCRNGQLQQVIDSSASNSECRTDIGASDLAGLVSQLEESKFSRLFRHLVCNDDDEAINKRTAPLAFPRAEVHLTSIEDTSNGFSAYFFHQLIHLPPALWYDDAVQEYCENSLWDALLGFKRRPDLLEMLDGMKTYQFYKDGHGPPQDYFPEDYFFFSNICHDIFRHKTECPANFRFRAWKLFERVLKIAPDHCPAFHVITPETILNSLGRSQASAFLVDLLNAPSGYYLLAREGRVSVIPATEYGVFFASPSGDVLDVSSPGLSATVTNRVAPSGSITPRILSEFELLLNTPRAKEADFQEYLRLHPQFLFALNDRYCEVRSQVCLYDAKGERLVPDFMARIHDSNLWDVIELKLPSSKPLVRYRTVEKASSAAARGIAELLQHRDYFSMRDNRRRVTQHFGVAPYEPSLVLVIGREDRAQRFEWNSTRIGYPRVQIVSYDYLFERARQICQCVAGVNLATRPQM